ncbi:MAG: GerAB/ArcD/ProY family transporter [Bacilli bacterium]
MNAATRLSGAQLFWLLTLFTIGMSGFMTIAPVICRAHNDAWMSMTLNLLVSTFLTFVSVRIALRYPGETLVQYSQSIVGKWVGRGVSLLYLLHWTTLAGIMVRQTSDFLITSEFHHTPLWVFIISMVAVVLYLLHKGGLDSLGRMALFLGPVIMGMILLTVWLSIPDGRLTRLLPLYFTNGGSSILQGVLPVFGYAGNGVVVGMLLPFVKNAKRNAYMAVWGVAVACLFLIGAAAQVVAVFGPDLPAAMWNPIFEMVRFISVADFVEEIEPFVIIFWFMSAVIRLSLFIFIASYGWSQLFQSSRAWPFLWAVGLITTVEAFLPRNIVYSSILYSRTIVEVWVAPVLFVAVPLLLWFVSGVKTRRTLDGSRRS